MPRRQFVADLAKAQSDALPAGVSNLQPGEDDGQFEFHYNKEASQADYVKVTALIPDLADYPKSHEYMIFSGEDAPLHIAEALQDLRRTRGKTVFELLDIVSTTLATKLADRDGDELMLDSQLDDDDEQLEESDDDDIYDSDHEAFETGAPKSLAFAQPSPGVPSKPRDRAFRARIRNDLIAAKKAGFKVGVLGHILDGFNAFVTISIRFGKLGISDEAMEAWQITPSDYLILILQYPNGYKTNEELQGYDSIRLQPNIGFRVVSGKTYKPTLQEAIKAFAVAKKEARDSIISNELPNAEDDTDRETSIKDTFISNPLNGLLQERLVVLLRWRSSGMTWSGAEEYYIHHAGAGGSMDDAVPDRYFEPEPVNPALPDIMNADHCADRTPLSHSFPLLAMQFVLRHFVRCTEFCLVCHRKMNTELEAIKPYVCESDLCLYQYMTLGFGPSIEHEILSQPYVVDLLVSFCYKSAATSKLKEYPDGLSLVVPVLIDSLYTSSNFQTPRKHPIGTTSPETATEKTLATMPTSYDVGFDKDRLEIIFFTPPPVCPVRRGDWIVIKTTASMAELGELHCRIADVTFFPTVSVNEPLVLKYMGVQDQVTSRLNESPAPTAKPVSPATTPKWTPASFSIYGEDFKSMSARDKCLTICRLLDTLPSVLAMQERLSQRGLSDLKSWVERISPAALSLLRWIIASNRACIMQVDGNERGMSKQERLYGMKDWMQFRFAMGAPDKEQRFLTEVRKTSDRLNLTHPTIFAWHGSPLHNWHMIIREGLHFKNIDHGRAFGHGVYHAPDAGTSTGYSGMYGVGMPGGPAFMDGWRSSVLRISTALALNELINAPAEFTSQQPHYVVQHLDWIQTRYLFVRCSPTLDSIRFGEDVEPQNPLEQDPRRIPKGASGGKIVIPASATKTHRIIQDARKPTPPKNPSPLKRLKMLGGISNPIPIDVDDDAASTASNESDVEVMFGTDPEPEPTAVEVTMVVPKTPQGPPTDFVPGTLDFSILPLMPLPIYATSNTTTRLMRELATCNKIQESTPSAELGWYIDAAKIDNAYQWILELHSFHMFTLPNTQNQKPLPLATDLKKKNLSSVVMEIRFNKDFPFTPPYVRVIRPRFLSLAQGGGGHVVQGGAMCMELLTNSGWSSVSSMESVLLQIRLAIASEPFARLDFGRAGDYGTGEAAEGYVRACRAHGWEVPPGFGEMAYGGGGV